MIATELARLLDPRPIRPAEARRALSTLVARDTDDSERAALLVALTARHLRPDELVAFAREMRRRARPFPIPARDRAIDLCGSGGAPTASFNVSTVASFVVRAAGVPVAKHANRSRRVCGSSDLLEALGLPVTTSVPFARAAYDELGITFLHAPLFHPETAAVAPVRQRLGIPTLFNRLGPLSNPAAPSSHVSGAADVRASVEASVALRALGVTRGVAMSSDDGCDEFSPVRPTSAVRWSEGRTHRVRLSPARLLRPEDRRGAWGPLPPRDARDETERILAGGSGARRGSVLLTAGAALLVSGVAGSWAEGIARAEDALDSGDAERLLGELRRLARRVRGRPNA